MLPLRNKYLLFYLVYLKGSILIAGNSHIGIVSDRRNKNGVPYVLYHNDPWHKTYEQDILESRHVKNYSAGYQNGNISRPCGRQCRRRRAGKSSTALFLEEIWENLYGKQYTCLCMYVIIKSNYEK